MSSRIAAIRGRLEFDAESWELLYGDGSCSLRLILFNVPALATIKLETWNEAGTRQYHQTRAYQAPASPKGQQSHYDHREAFTLASSGRFRVEIHTKKYVHAAEYRIDKRPVRTYRNKLEMFTEDHFYGEEAYNNHRREQTLNLPFNSLWAWSQHNQI
jgi:hypothetical protein